MVMAPTFNPSTWKAEEGNLFDCMYGVSGQSELHSETLPPKTKNKNKKKPKMWPLKSPNILWASTKLCLELEADTIGAAGCGGAQTAR